MADRTSGRVDAPLQLPDNPSLEWLRKQAKRRLREMRATDQALQLSDAQLDLATQYGFPSWRALKAQLESLSVEGRLVKAARDGDAGSLKELLDRHPDKLYARMEPHDWSLLHFAAKEGNLEIVDLLLGYGIDPNTRESGDNTYPIHWAASAGALNVVRRLVRAGGDVVGRGDDHDLEVIGWATCWDGCDDDAHRAVADFLVGEGAQHHIFSAIALEVGDEVRRLVAADPSTINRRQSRNEDSRTPLQFAVAKKRDAMIALLLDLGADPLAVDGSGQTIAAYATAPDTDRRVMEKIHAMVSAELISADRGRRPARASTVDLVAVLALADWDAAARLVRENPGLIKAGGGALHLVAKRNDETAVKWLLDHEADPNGRWAHWDAEVTPLHLAASQGHSEIVRLLLAAGADPHIRDTKHHSDAVGWANRFRRPAIARLLESSPASRQSPVDE